MVDDISTGVVSVGASFSLPLDIMNVLCLGT